MRYHIVVDGQELPDENKRRSIRLMIEKPIERGVSAAAIGKILPSGRFRPVKGEHHTDEEVREALSEQYLRIDVRPWFTENPFVEDGTTWVLHRMWGRKIEPTLAALRDAFPDMAVTFRRAIP